MTKLSLTEVEKIAHLARLNLTDEEKAIYQEQLSTILEYVEMLQQVDTTDVPPTTSAIPLDNVMRQDVAQPGLSTEDALLNAPDAAENSFRVKPIL